MKHLFALAALLLSSALAMRAPQRFMLTVGQTVSATENDTLMLEASTYTWKKGKSSLCPNITDPSSKIKCVRMGSLELIFTKTTAGKATQFTLIYGDGKRLEQRLGGHRLKVLGVDFPKPTPTTDANFVSCPPQAELRVTLEKLR